jgi:hypothetical protein
MLRMIRLAAITPVLRRPERLGLDRLDLKVRLELQDRGVKVFQVENHLPQSFVGPFDFAGQLPRGA